MAKLRNLSIQLLDKLWTFNNTSFITDITSDDALELFKDQDINAVLNAKTGDRALHCVLAVPPEHDEEGWVQSCLSLLKAGADLNLGDIEGRTPLMRLAITPFPLTQSSDPFDPYVITYTTNDVMFRNEMLYDEILSRFDILKLKVLELMLGYNLDITKKDKHNKTALDHAFAGQSVQQRKSNGLEDRFLCRLLELSLPSMRESESYKANIKALSLKYEVPGALKDLNQLVLDHLTNQTEQQAAPDAYARHLLAEERQAYKDFCSRGHLILHKFKTELKAHSAREKAHGAKIEALELELSQIKLQMMTLNSVAG